MPFKNMTPSEQCKQAGLKSLDEVSKLSGQSVQTLINWHKNKPKLFMLLILGCIVEKTNQHEEKNSNKLKEARKNGCLNEQIPQ